MKKKQWPKTRKWKAHWIYPAEYMRNPGLKNIYSLFRREFSLTSAQTITLYISANTRYRLFMDGIEQGEGPLRSQAFNMYYDVYHLPLETGKHCLASEVYFIGSEGQGGTAQPGFLLEAVNEKAETVLTSDGSWCSLISPAWDRNTQQFKMNRINAFQEFFDARKNPVDSRGYDWRSSGFNDSRWADSDVIMGRMGPYPPQAGPWSLIQERDIPLMETTSVLPRSVIKAEECISLANRQRSEDISIRLSMAGKRLKYTKVKNPENLCRAEGKTILCCSTNHLNDKGFDGFYDPALTIDFGKQQTAYLELTVEGSEGAIIEYGFSERLIDDSFNNSLEGFFGGKYILKGGGKEIFKTFNWIGFRFLRLRITSAFENLTIHSCLALDSTYPYNEINAFSSDDERINSIYSMCKNTIRLCSNEFLMDTPWREQGQWLGDVAAVTLGGIYSCFGNGELVEKFLSQSAATQLPTGLITNMTNTTDMNWEWVIPDYTLWWVWAVWNHYEYTGDENWIHHLYPHILKVLHYFTNYTDETGLLYRVPAWNLIDWAPLDRRGYSAGMNAIYHIALEAMEKMTLLRNDEFYLTMIRNQKCAIEKTFASTFYDPSLGLCVDCMEEGKKSSVISEHTNALALMQNLVDEESKKSILHKVFEIGSPDYVEAQPYFCTFSLIALNKEGRIDLAMKMLLDRWGGRMADKGNTSCHEEWGRNGSWRNGEYSGFMRTLSHAWSAYPAQFLVQELTGFKIREAGCGKISLYPADIGVDYHVNLSVPQGVISVIMKNGERVISLPEGVRMSP